MCSEATLKLKNTKENKISKLMKKQLKLLKTTHMCFVNAIISCSILATVLLLFIGNINSVKKERIVVKAKGIYLIYDLKLVFFFFFVSYISASVSEEGVL